MGLKLRRRVMPTSPKQYVYAHPIGGGSYRIDSPGDLDHGREATAAELADDFAAVGEGVDVQGWREAVRFRQVDDMDAPGSADDVPPAARTARKKGK